MQDATGGSSTDEQPLQYYVTSKAIIFRLYSTDEMKPPAMKAIKRGLISQINPTEPTNQPTSQPTNQPTSQPTNQPANQSTNQPASQPTNQPANQSTNQPANKP